MRKDPMYVTADGLIAERNPVKFSLSDARLGVWTLNGSALHLQGGRKRAATDHGSPVLRASIACRITWLGTVGAGCSPPTRDLLAAACAGAMRSSP
jgi:hypothetical protein